MKRIVSICCALLILPLSSCVDESAEGNRTVFKVDRAAKKQEGSRFGYNSPERRKDRTAPRERRADTDAPESTGDGGNASSPENSIVRPDLGPDAPVEDSIPDPGPTTTTPPVESSPPPASAPFAKQVPGQPGLVYSPFAPGKEVSVKGYPPGTLVKCPYTQKEFKVP